MSPKCLFCILDILELILKGDMNYEKKYSRAVWKSCIQ